MCLLFLCISFSAGQDIPTTPATKNASESEQVEPLKIRLSVNEVRLDVVVLDKKGNPITDLTADDFEVYQDNKLQDVLSSVYIDSPQGVAEQSAAVQKEQTNLISQHAPALKKEDVGRTIMFLVDDFVMTFENGYHTKMALRNFVEKQMQPGDLVSILRTGYGNSALNMFYSNKREVLARINAMPSPLFSTKAILRDEKTDWGLFIENQISALSYSLRALKDMPGRKILIMMSPTYWPYSVSYLLTVYTDDFTKLADYALRAGVVVNLLDIDGLFNFMSLGADASSPPSQWTFNSFNRLMFEEQLRKRLEAIGNEPVFMPNPLPDKTGGVIIQDSNFFLEGIGKETESLMRGYYLISYTPPQDTFKGRGRKDDYRRLKVRVKREDAKVYTRDGFFGRLESEMDADTPQNPLYAAIYSPFQSTDLNVDIAAGYVKDAKAGYFVRSWIHLDPENVKIIETQNGNRIDLEAIYVASGISGNIEDSKRVEFSLSGFNADWIRKHGIRFSTLLPIKKPGPYYIRISIQDKETGKVGSAYQFLEIPDLKKKGLALSNIFMITSADDLAWMSLDMTKEGAEGVFFPMYQGEESRSPTLRTYKPGDMIHTLALLYNADAKAIGRSEIETQTILYKDGKEFMRSNAGSVTMDKVENPGSIPILNRLTVGSNMPPGDYVLQLVVTDKKNSRSNEGAASQTMGFTVVEE